MVQRQKHRSPSDRGIRNKRTQPKRVLMKELVAQKGFGYFFMVLTSPLKRDREPNPERIIYHGLFSQDAENAPWVLIRDRYHRNESIHFPITLCGGLYDSLQTMVIKDKDDWTFDVTKLQRFKLMETVLNNYVECPNEDVQREITADAAKKEKTEDLDDEKVVWLRTGPVRAPEEGEVLPQHKRTNYLRVYEELVPNLLAFLLDIKMRYTKRDISPEKAVSMLSDSGERRFFFDVRNTRYGYRLHISQVSNKNRMVIGIPLESVVMARDSLNEVIQTYNLHEEANRTILRKYCQNVILVRRNRNKGRNDQPAGNDQPADQVEEASPKKAKTGRAQRYSKELKDTPKPAPC
ncbi:hypothetical protein Aperf_G00000010409 [Anoplocephala perfoliata]